MSQRIRLLERGQGTGFTREIAIQQEEYLFGRGADCDLRLLHDAVSRHHCSLRLQGDDVFLIDHGSANGTYRNGERVLSQTQLHSGDEIRVGNFTFVVMLGGEVPVGKEAHADPIAGTVRLPKPKVG